MFRVFRLISFVQKHDNSSVIDSTEMILVASILSNTSLYTNTGRALNGRETERLVSRFPGLMDRQVNIRIANSPQRNYRRIRRPRWPTVSAKSIDKRAHLPFMKRSREGTSRPNRIATISSRSSSLFLSLSPLCTRVYQYVRSIYFQVASLSLSLSFEKR